MINKAIFPLSADPITKGHLSLIKRSLSITKKLFIVILNNKTKKPLFSLLERKSLLEKCSLDFSRISIIAEDTMLVDIAKRVGVKVIIRGIRTPFDIQNEMDFNHVYLKQNPELEFIYFLAKTEFKNISSSLAKSLLSRGGNVKEYFSLPVKKALEEKVLGQYRLIVTGVIASGKTLIVKKIIQNLKAQNINALEIDFDKIVKEIYEKINNPNYKKYKKKLLEYFFPHSASAINLTQEMIKKKVFNGDLQKNLEFLQNTLNPIIHQLYQEKIKNQKGIIFLNAPLGAEYDMLGEGNNQVFFIEVSLEKQKKYLQAREPKITNELLHKKIKAAKTNQKKRKIIDKIITRDKYGSVITYKNNFPLDEKKVKSLAEKIIKHFKI